jgi:hypothetical protein
MITAAVNGDVDGMPKGSHDNELQLKVSRNLMRI